MALQLQWNLDQTSASIITVARGVLRAATSDNVQPLAILACEKFGNTIAMSPEVLSKIEKSVIPIPEPVVLGFLKSSIGYSSGDCISYFGKSIAGLHFLALAAAMVTTMVPHKAATAIQGMLASTATDKTLLPTVRQLCGLLESVEPRCHRSGFADEVAGYHILLSRSGGRTQRITAGKANVPNDQGIQSLVDAIRQLGRVGSDDITKVTVQTNACAAWTMAFAKWSLGQPPSVVLWDGTPILEQEGSRFTVIITRSRGSESAQWGDEPFKVTIHSAIHAPSSLVLGRDNGIAVGMRVGR
ncbi:hypothetical protein NKR19_g3030 [Coniochaeta hoffmannii]|uniref:Uncharacterized protein n=1 Tax=Coniochaeta hoffmannii TaxID=91930 RepID=A0AA38VZA8_9PEZI|nr:hypothetical protein NKR19_g3030 [Coniochaeta hoffmannii]